MTRMIDSIGHLTELRERDELETTLASVMFDLVGPDLLIVWRIANAIAAPRLRESIRLTAADQITISNRQQQVDELPLLQDYPALHACWSTRTQLMTRCEDGKTDCYVYPIGSELDVLALLEIHVSAPLREYQQRLIAGLVRIYRNHLRVLDEGDLDPLTGLFNRKRFDELFRRLTTCTEPAIRQLKPYVLLGNRRPPNPHQSPWIAVADIDYFKKVNDNFGHDYGDEVLLLVSRFLRSNLRDTDCVFRFGGEEFVLLLSPTEPQFAAQVMERCRSGVQAISVPRVGHVTVSIGFARVNANETGAEAFGRADKALYVAKKNGRNQVQSYERLQEDGKLERSQPVESLIEFF